LYYLYGGLAFFVLGLVSSTPLGAEILSDYGWEATTDPVGFTTGLCVPVNLSKFVSIPSWILLNPHPSFTSLPPLTSAIEQDVLRAIQNLGNSVIANSSSRTLARIKSRGTHADVFSSVALCCHVFNELARQRYRLPVRRYILDLLDLQLSLDTVQLLAAYTESAQGGDFDCPSSASLERRQDRSTSDGEDDGDMQGSKQSTGAIGLILAKPMQRVEGFHVPEIGVYS